MPKRFTKRNYRKASVEVVANSYRYQPLDEAKKQVRISRLARGNIHQPIRGFLIVTSLRTLRRPVWRQLRRLTALSYTWGTLKRDKSIEMSQEKLCITESLHHALQYLRFEDRERYLWIDQVCIDQKNTRERIQQVQLMWSIYSQASDVVAWLGTANTVQHVFRTIESSAFASPDFPWIEFREKWESSSTTEKQEMLYGVLQFDQSKVMLQEAIQNFYGGIAEMTESQWFKRVWTLQVAVLAQKLSLQVGCSTMSWETVVLV
jgi:hypothetical protein